MDELTSVISKAYVTAVGPDNTRYQMLKHLPAAVMEASYEPLITSGLAADFQKAGEHLLSYQS